MGCMPSWRMAEADQPGSADPGTQVISEDIARVLEGRDGRDLPRGRVIAFSDTILGACRALVSGVFFAISRRAEAVARP